ncbi:MAG: hypothetical protein GY749_04325 [Desulfobacteraceae bacterium]|nr:hypothetical protein [Desulfobacteraceae bacterium]
MGKWINNILTPTALPDTAEHIPLEDLARLAGGQADPKERIHCIRHLNRCPVCYEILQETLADLPDEAALPVLSRWSANRRIYALAASILVIVLIGGLYFKYHIRQPPVLTASLVLDVDIKSVLTEDNTLEWEGDRAERVAVLLRNRGVQAGKIRKVILASPYVASKSLFGPDEILIIRIQGDTAYIEVKEKD